MSAPIAVLYAFGTLYDHRCDTISVVVLFLDTIGVMLDTISVALDCSLVLLLARIATKYSPIKLFITVCTGNHFTVHLIVNCRGDSWSAHLC